MHHHIYSPFQSTMRWSCCSFHLVRLFKCSLTSKIIYPSTPTFLFPVPFFFLFLKDGPKAWHFPPSLMEIYYRKWIHSVKLGVYVGVVDLFSPCDYCDSERFKYAKCRWTFSAWGLWNASTSPLDQKHLQQTIDRERGIIEYRMAFWIWCAILAFCCWHLSSCPNRCVFALSSLLKMQTQIFLAILISDNWPSPLPHPRYIFHLTV